jgi:hypothetical protein
LNTTAWALWWDGLDVLSGLRVTSWRATVAVLSGCSVVAVTSWWTGWARWTLLAAAVHASGLTSNTAALLLDLWANLQGVLPHRAGSRLAVVELRMHGRLQRLHVLEDEREADEAGGHSHGREDHGGEGRQLHVGALVGLHVELIVFAHR